MLFDKPYDKIHFISFSYFFPFFLISEHYAHGNITIFHLERGILKKTKMKFHKMDDFGLQTTSKSHTLTWKNEDGILSEEDDLLLQGSL